MKPVKVLCGAPCGKIPVYDHFYDSFGALILPPDSIKVRASGGSIPLNLNTLVETAKQQECSHLFIVEDDSSFHPDTVMQLLAHDKPVVTGICRARHAPFKPYIYKDLDPGLGLTWYELTEKDRGLIKVGATGLGGILIKMNVFDKLAKPYFKHFHVGEREFGQDVVFGMSLIEAGVKVYCDLDVVIWHATQCVVGSEFVENEWRTVIKVNEAVFKVKTI